VSARIDGYRDLIVWGRAMDLAEQAYFVSKRFPHEERYGLTSQIRRAAASVPANIAEGYGRQTRPAYVSHLRIAQGSLKELETHLMLAARVQLCSSAEIEPLLADADEIGRMLRALIVKLTAKR